MIYTCTEYREFHRSCSCSSPSAVDNVCIRRPMPLQNRGTSCRSRSGGDRCERASSHAHPAHLVLFATNVACYHLVPALISRALLLSIIHFTTQIDSGIQAVIGRTIPQLLMDHVMRPTLDESDQTRQTTCTPATRSRLRRNIPGRSQPIK